MLEKGLNRFKKNQIQEDNLNQGNARLELMHFFDVHIDTQDMMSYWDWEFYRNNQILAIGEYRRRFCKFGKYEDFQFSKKKFDAMVLKGNQDHVPAYMFVEFDDLFLYFPIEGNPSTKIMRRNHEIRTEECVCILNNEFKYLYQLEI
jgi:hypothetical protein